jgi:hypothetical protein
LFSRFSLSEEKEADGEGESVPFVREGWAAVGVGSRYRESARDVSRLDEIGALVFSLAIVNEVKLFAAA